MTQTQTPLQQTSPVIAREAWHEATEAHKIASIRRAKAKEHLEEIAQKIKHATQNGTVTTSTIDGTLADLARRQSTAMIRVEEAEAGVKRAAKELKVAWTAFQPFADEEARGTAPTRITRVSVLMEQSRRVTAGVKDGAAPPPGPAPKTKPSDIVEAQIAKRPAGPAGKAKAAQPAAAIAKEAVSWPEDRPAKKETPFPAEAAERAARRGSRKPSQK